MPRRSPPEPAPPPEVGRADAAPRPPRTRRDPERRRAEVLDHAVAAFAEQGFARTTFDDIAARAGLSKGAVYHYFETKEELFGAVVEERLVPRIALDEAAVAVAVAADDGHGDLVLEQVMSRLWDTIADPHLATLAQVALLEMPRTPPVAELFYQAVVIRGRDAILAVLRRAVATGRLPADLPVESLAWAVSPMIVGTVLLLDSIGRLHTPSQKDELARRCKADTIGTIMAGLRAGAR